jgi:anti-sigma regulatory factor (Ser/Thr protein kinase)
VDTSGDRRSDGARLVATTHEPVATVGPRIRRYVRDLLVNWGLGGEIVENALIVVEELVANVVDHAHTRFALVVRLSGQVLRIAVRDGCASDPVLQPFDPNAERGRGLQLVASLSQRWGFDHHDGGKTVWADLAA